MVDHAIETTTTTTQAVTHLRARCGVRYWGDATVNGVEDTHGDLIPCREGDDWCPVIDLATGRILDWPDEVSASVHYKVCDDGSYTLLHNGEMIARIESYVPAIMSPGGTGYGDYVIMNIGPDGVIENWKVKLEAFAKNEK